MYLNFRSYKVQLVPRGSVVTLRRTVRHELHPSGETTCEAVFVVKRPIVLETDLNTRKLDLCCHTLVVFVQ